MSIYSWAIIFQKAIYLRQIEKKTTNYTEKSINGANLAEVVKISEAAGELPAAKIFLSCVKELSGLRKLGNSYRWSMGELDIFLNRVSEGVLADSAKVLEKKMSTLASIGSTAPFVGLFGTVTGVVSTLYEMGISGEQDQFNQVAPGLSAALIATAFGLFVAIPAVVSFNYFRAKIRSIHLKIEAFKLHILNKLLVPPPAS
ncbi:MAG: MotA/TolQ/ExbB proton channel family protein [SAR324 cluster bacterium]|nr:MotA/TolQ/ExbB proton channel family protein [SAR324 cluster bacterium]